MLAGSVACLTALSSWPARATPAERIVEEAAQAFLKEAPQAIGLSVGVFDGTDQHHATFGRRSKDDARVPAPDTIYPIASITKTFTGTLLAQASIEGRLGLDDDVRRYLDGDFANLEFGGEPMRLWHLLNHNSGLPFRLPDMAETRPPFPAPSAEVARMLAAYGREDFYRDLRSVKIERQPGTGFVYSNAGATLLSYVLERVLGDSYEALVRKRIAAPLGMTDTFVVPGDGQSIRVARGFDESGREVPPPDASMLGAAAIKSTVADLLRYARWHCREGDQAVRLSHEPHPVSGNFAVGLNWQMTAVGARRRIWQDGTAPGYAAMCMFLPQADVGLVAFSNQLDPGSMQAFQAVVRRIILGLAPGSDDLF
jgi:CubicO group peptidase (beta-lactamase class C family)